MVERVRGGGRLEGSVRHHAQPSAISNPYLPLPTPCGDRLPATLRAHYHIFSFYILFRTALLLIVVPFSTLALSAALSATACHRRERCFSCFSLDSREKIRHLTFARFSRERRLKNCVLGGLRDFQSFPSPPDILVVPLVSPIARLSSSVGQVACKLVRLSLSLSREHSISTVALTRIKPARQHRTEFRKDFLFMCPRWFSFNAAKFLRASAVCNQFN